MGLFALRVRRPAGDPGTGGVLPAGARMGPPRRFRAVAEALVSGSDPGEACAAVGRELALDGASLEESMAALRETWQCVHGTDPSYDATAALLVAWSEAALSYFHALSCEDPMTGLATRVHVRSRLGDLYRQHGWTDVNADWALVVCELTDDAGVDGGFDGGVDGGVDGGADGGAEAGQRLARSLRLARVGEAARTVFAGGETVGRLAPNRVVVVAARTDRLGTRVRLLRSLVAGMTDAPPRVWIEGLPPTDLAASQLLDELARA